MVGVAATIALLGGSTPARAEGAGNGPAAECRQAANRLRAYDQSAVNSGGHAAQGNGKAEERQIAAARLLTCGEMGGEEAATTLSATRFLTDPGALEELVGPFRYFRDAAVFGAAMDVADDRTASVPARVLALRTLWVLRSGKIWIAYEQMLPADEATVAIPTGRCGAGIRLSDATPYWIDGALPPADFASQILALAERIRADASQPLIVRAAATCALRR